MHTGRNARCSDDNTSFAVAATLAAPDIELPDWLPAALQTCTDHNHHLFAHMTQICGK